MFRRLMVLGVMVLPALVFAGEQGECTARVMEIAGIESPEKAFEWLQLCKTQEDPNKFSNNTHGSQSFSLKEFQEETLREGEIFIDTRAGHLQSILFVVTRTQCRLLVIPGEKELIPQFLHLRNLVSNGDSDQKQLDAAIANVSNMLFGELTNSLDTCSNIVLAADGVFNLLPVSVLLSGYENMTFSRVPSASTLAEIYSSFSSMAPVTKPRTLAVGGVVDTKPDNLVEPFLEMEDLDDAYVGVTVVKPNSGGSAPELNKLNGFDIIHVAASFFVDDRHVQQSAIALDPSNPEMMIRVADLNNVKLDTKLMVLANCTTETDALLSGVGFQALSSALLNAGVPTVVASLWPVNDDARRFFMSAFYSGLSQGLNAGNALAFAKRVCRQDQVFSPPVNWGSFVLVGEGRQEIHLREKPGMGLLSWILGILGIGLALIVVIFKIRH